MFFNTNQCKIKIEVKCVRKKQHAQKLENYFLVSRLESGREERGNYRTTFIALKQHSLIGLI